MNENNKEKKCEHRHFSPVCNTCGVDLISQERERAYEEGAKEAYDADIELALNEARQETLQQLRDAVRGDDDATDTLEEIINSLDKKRE